MTSPTAAREAPKLRLEILGTDEPPWTRWPGRWGDTLPRQKGLESDSPTGPGAKKQWTAPDKLLDSPPKTSRHEQGDAGPDVQALRSGGRLRLVYDVTARSPRPHALVVTVNSADEAGVPPQTINYPVHSTGMGKVTTDIVLDPLKRYDVNTSTIAGDPPVPSRATRTLIAAFGDGEPKLGLGRRVLTVLSRIVAWIRGDRRS